MALKKMRLTSIENAPLIRKFTVLFIVMSLLPFLIIAYLFKEYFTSGSISLSVDSLFILLFLVGAGTLAGFYGMRKSILKIQDTIQQATRVLSKDIPALNEIKSEDSEITQLTRAFNEITKDLENNIKRLESSRHTMQYVLSKLTMGISSLQTIDTFLDLIIEITTNAMYAKVGVLMLLDHDKQELFIKSSSGLNENFKNLRLKVGEEGPGWVAKYKKPLLVPRLHKTENHQEKDPFMLPLLCVPMVYQDKLVGILAVSGKLTADNFQEDELIIISNLASQTAIAVENDRLHLDAEKTYLETISALALAVEVRDPYSRGHSDRVSQYSVKVAEKLALAQDEINDIKNAAELHDVGKIGISDGILKNIGMLNKEEMEIMRKHPIIGEAIVKPVHSMMRLCSIIRHHHEWLDGGGYPDKLKGEEIPLGAKILSITDSFDAMTTDRPYRKALSLEEAKEEIKKYIDIRYDRKVAETFLGLV